MTVDAPSRRQRLTTGIFGRQPVGLLLSAPYAVFVVAVFAVPCAELPTEVWQVANALTPGVLAGSVLFFGLAAVFFLVMGLFGGYVHWRRDLYLEDEFKALAAKYANFNFIVVLSQPEGNTTRRTGFVTDAVAKDLQDFDGWKAYVAGPPPMVEAAMQICTARGLRSEDLHADVFFTPAEASARR